MSNLDFDKVQQNLKVVITKKSVGFTDKEIAKSLDMTTQQFLDTINSDEYLKDCYENASAKVAKEIEESFIENIKSQLATGDNTDAKWYLERTTAKYSKKEQLSLTTKSIDEINREHDEQ